VEIWHLDSRDLYGVPSVNNYEQIIKQLVESSPSWEKDGGGIRGRTLAPILSGLSSGGAMNDFGSQQFNQNNNESIQRTASDPIADLILTERGGGGGAQCVGLALYVKTVGTAPDTTQQVWVGAGTIAGQLPPDFDYISGKSIASGGSGNVWVEVNINDQTGESVSVAVSGGGATPENTDTSFYYTLGYYEYNDGTPAVTNYACGSLDVVICRNWFAVEAPFYGVNMNRCGCNY